MSGSDNLKIQSGDERSGSDTGRIGVTVLHPDIVQTHILTRLDGPTLASASASSSQLRSLSREPGLWTEICRDTWPSTDAPRVQEVISSASEGHRSFFADSFPFPTSYDSNNNGHRDCAESLSELISAVDLRYRGEMILSKVVETETSSGWFLHSPFRVDLLHRKDVVPTAAEFRHGGACRDLAAGLELSWIAIDPASGRAANLSSFRPVEVRRHVISGDVHVRFAAVVAAGERGSPSELVQCGVLVTCGGSQAGLLHVREVCLVVEDLDGTHLKGKDSLVILRRVLEGKRGKGVGREMEGKRRYDEFLERKRERKEKKQRIEGLLDVVSVSLLIGGLAIFSLFWATMRR